MCKYNCSHMVLFQLVDKKVFIKSINKDDSVTAGII